MIILKVLLLYLIYRRKTNGRYNLFCSCSRRVIFVCIFICLFLSKDSLLVIKLHIIYVIIIYILERKFYINYFYLMFHHKIRPKLIIWSQLNKLISTKKIRHIELMISHDNIGQLFYKIKKQSSFFFQIQCSNFKKE